MSGESIMLTDINDVLEAFSAHTLPQGEFIVPFCKLINGRLFDKNLNPIPLEFFDRFSIVEVNK